MYWGAVQIELLEWNVVPSPTHLLEAALKGGVLLNVLPVLVQRGGANQAQLRGRGEVAGGAAGSVRRPASVLV